MGIFAWLRSAVRDAILGGVNDALEQLNTAGPPAGEPVTLLLTVQARPAVEEDPGVNGRGRKAARSS